MFPPEKWNAPVEYPQLADYLSKYQDPKQADTIMRVQNELDETTAILVKYPFISKCIRKAASLIAFFLCLAQNH